MENKNTFKVLCLEDSQEDFGLINYHLGKSEVKFATERVDTREEFIHCLRTSDIDLILSDHALPQFNSLEALKLVQELRPDLPFILVTGAVSEEFAVNCIRLGADDYVLKTNLKDLKDVIVKSLKTREDQATKTRIAKELAKQNQELSRLNKELDSFVYSVTHNLRSPLRSILGLLNLSKSEKQLENIHYYHELMENCIDKLDKSLVEILEYSRNSTQEYKVEKVSIKALIQDTFEKVLFMPGFDNLKRDVKIHDDVDLYSDSYRLSVILHNLISNAVKYQDPSKDVSTLRIVAEVDKTFLTMQVEDNGIGIPSEYLPNLFKMFYRATDKGEGAGLGLYIVKEAIDLLNGQISIHSQEGKGTTFTLKIPNNVFN